jgi:hypothetical protein
MRVVRLAAAPAAGVLLSTGLFVHTRGLDEVAQAGQLGPGFWPRLVLSGLCLACLVQLVNAVRAAALERRGGGSTLEPIDRASLVRALILLVLYVVAIPSVGFAASTFVFVAAFMALAGARSVPRIGATAALATVAVLYVFVKLVYLPLPKGGGPAETLTIGLYRALGIF